MNITLNMSESLLHLKRSQQYIYKKKGTILQNKVISSLNWQNMNAASNTLKETFCENSGDIFCISWWIQGELFFHSQNFSISVKFVNLSLICSGHTKLSSCSHFICNTENLAIMNQIGNNRDILFLMTHPPVHQTLYFQKSSKRLHTICNKFDCILPSK